MRFSLENLKNSLRRILSLVKKEFIVIWKDPKSRGMIIALPLIQLFVFSNAITMEVTNIDMVVLDRANSVESRELIAKFDNSTRFRHIFYAQNEIELKKHIETQKAQLGLEIGNDFSRAIKQNKPTSIQIIADGRQTNSAAIGSGYASQIINEYSNSIMIDSGVRVNPIVRNWFNSNLTYKWYLLQTIVVLLALIITLLLTALSIARERELGTFDQLVVSPLTSFEILVGKTIPPLMIAFILTTIMMLIVTLGFHVPLVGSKALLFLLIVVSLLSIVGVGLFISSICKTQQQAILGVMVFQTPAVLLSGFVSPIEDMPMFFQYLTYLNPVRFFISTARGIFFKDICASEVFINLIPLALIALFTLSLASWTFKKNLD